MTRKTARNLSTLEVRHLANGSNFATKGEALKLGLVAIVIVLLAVVVFTTVWIFQTKRAESERANQKSNRHLLAQLSTDLELARGTLAQKKGLYSDYKNGLIQIRQIEIRYENIYGNTMKSVYVINHTDRAISKIIGFWDMGTRSEMVMGAPMLLRMKRECVFPFSHPIEVGSEVCVGETPWTENGGLPYGRLRITGAVNDRDSKSSPPFDEKEIWELKNQTKSLKQQIDSLAKKAR